MWKIKVTVWIQHVWALMLDTVCATVLSSRAALTLGAAVSVCYLEDLLRSTSPCQDCCQDPTLSDSVPFFSLQVSCCSFEDSSTTPESARWPTPCPPCRALESSSSIELTIAVSIITFFLLFSETYGLLLANQRGRKEPPPPTLTWFGQYKIYPPLLGVKQWMLRNLLKKALQSLLVNC